MVHDPDIWHKTKTKLGKLESDLNRLKSEKRGHILAAFSLAVLEGREISKILFSSVVRQIQINEPSRVAAITFDDSYVSYEGIERSLVTVFFPKLLPCLFSLSFIPIAYIAVVHILDAFHALTTKLPKRVMYGRGLPNWIQPTPHCYPFECLTSLLPFNNLSWNRSENNPGSLARTHHTTAHRSCKLVYESLSSGRHSIHSPWGDNIGQGTESTTTTIVYPWSSFLVV